MPNPAGPLYSVGLMRGCIVAAALILCCGFAVPATPTSGGREVIAVVDNFHAALRRGDAKAALAPLDWYVVIYEAGGAEFRRTEYERAHLAADIAFASATTSRIVRRNYAGVGDIAWVLTQYRVKGRFRGRDIDHLTDETMVLRLVRGAWRIVHIHWSSKAAN